MGSQPPSQKGTQPPIFGPFLLWPAAGWIKMPLRMEVGLGPGHIVLDGDPAPLSKKGACSISPLIFSLCLLWPNGWMHQDATWYDGRPQPGQHCVRRGPSSTPMQGAQPPSFGPCLLWPNGWVDQDATWYKGRPRPRPYYVTWDPAPPPKRGTVFPIFGPCLDLSKRSPI